MLDKDQIMDLLNSRPFISLKEVKIQFFNKKKDARISVPRGFLSTNVILEDKKYTIIIIQED
jgi:hypothetical protein